LERIAADVIVELIGDKMTAAWGLEENVRGRPLKKTQGCSPRVSWCCERRKGRVRDEIARFKREGCDKGSYTQ
jgi:hypothetical protein